MRLSLRIPLVVAAMAGTLSWPAAATGQQRGLTVAEAPNVRTAFGRYHAILFAVGEQSAQSDLPSLRFPISEADSLRSVLIRQYTFDSSDVRVVRNPTGDQIVDALDSLGRLAYMIRPAVSAVARTSVQYGQFAGVCRRARGIRLRVAHRACDTGVRRWRRGTARRHRIPATVIRRRCADTGVVARAAQ